MRVVVKNLPVRTSQEEIREYFSKKWAVTDIYMLVNDRRIFRRVAFIGFQDQETAEAVVKYFDNAMFHNNKISVALAEDEQLEPKEVVKYAHSESSLRRILYFKTIYIRWIPSGIGQEVIRREIGKIGKVTSIKFEENKDKTALIVQFADGNTAVRAAKNLRVLAGVRVRISAHNEDLQKKRKEFYNSLFFTFDSVLKYASDAARVEKRAVADISDKKLGSNIALIEADLVQQTKSFLERNDIFISDIDGEINRRVLVLRCPDILGAIDLVKGEYRVDIAPSRCLALLRFESERAAEEARNMLNLKRHKSHIIYCEYAPKCSGIERDTARETEVKVNKIIVKNVPFQATVDDLKSIFSSCSHIAEIRLPLKDKKMHRGFAFIVLNSPKDAAAVLDRFGTNTHLFGRRLVLEPAKL